MTPQELKESLLWNAIQGKLTTQDDSESVDKSLVAFSTKHSLLSDDYYFDIPTNWVWVKIGEVFDLVNGKAFKPSDWSNAGIPIVRIQNLNDKSAPYNYCNTQCEEKYYLHGGELLFSWSGTPGTSFGAFIWHGGDAVLNQHIFIVYPRINASTEYLMYALNAELKIFIEKAHGGAGLKHITKKDFDSCYLPIPPLAEQKRIVAKIEELLPLIDRYEKAYNQLEGFNKRFPDDLQKSILQLAIQGKLVEQRAGEGTGEELYQQIQQEKQALIKAGKSKKEKPLPEITEDEIPFEIPESWMWIRFGECGVLKSGFAFKSTEYSTSGIQVVRISDLNEDCVSIKNAVFYPRADSLSSYLVSFNSFLICLTGSIGKMAWVRDNIPRYLNQRVGMFEPLSKCDPSFLWWFLHNGLVLNQWVKAKTSTNGNIKNSDVTDLVMPLPPLAEQKRIVAKLEELLPMCEKMKGIE